MNNLNTPRFLDPNTPPTLFTLVVIAATAALSLNIFLPSLPAITEYYGASYGVIQFLISGYLLTTAIVQFLVGPLSDRFGRRPVLLGGLMLFIIASVICATAENITILLMARVLQSSVVAGFAVSRAAIRDMISGKGAASMIGYVSMGMAIAPMMAPTLGGFLQEFFGWQAAFWVLAAAGSFTLLLVWRDLGETNLFKSSSMSDQFRSYPALLKSRRFWAYAGCAGLASACFFAMLGGAPFVGDVVYGLSPSQLGLYFIFTPMGYMLGNFFTGRYAERFGIYHLMITGTVITTVGMTLSLIVILLGAAHPMAFFGFTISIGIGNGLVIPNATAGMLGIHPRLAGTAAGLGGAMLTLSGAAISALVAILLTEDRGVYPLLICIIVCAVLAYFLARYAASVENEMESASPV